MRKRTAVKILVLSILVPVVLFSVGVGFVLGETFAGKHGECYVFPDHNPYKDYGKYKPHADEDYPYYPDEDYDDRARHKGSFKF